MSSGLYTLEEAATQKNLGVSKLGGKGYNLKIVASEFSSSTFQPVPAALLCTTDLYKYHLDSIKGLNNDVSFLYKTIGRDETNDLKLYHKIHEQIVNQPLNESVKRKIRYFLKINK